MLAPHSNATRFRRYFKPKAVHQQVAQDKYLQRSKAAIQNIFCGLNFCSPTFKQQAAAKNRKQHAILLVVACVLLLTHAPIVAEEAASLSEQSMLLKSELSGAKSSLMSVSATTAPDWGISPLDLFRNRPKHPQSPNYKFQQSN